MTFPLAIKHHGFLDMLYCHFTDMQQVLCILCNTTMLWIFVCAVVEVLLWKHRHSKRRSREARRRQASMLIQRPSWMPWPLSGSSGSLTTSSPSPPTLSGLRFRSLCTLEKHPMIVQILHVCGCGWYKLYSGKRRSGKKLASRWQKHGPKDIRFDDCAIRRWRSTGYLMTYSLAKKHHGFVDMLYCHFADMQQVLCLILCNTFMLWIFVCSLLSKTLLWKHRHSKRRSREARRRRASMLVLLMPACMTWLMFTCHAACTP